MQPGEASVVFNDVYADESKDLLLTFFSHGPSDLRSTFPGFSPSAFGASHAASAAPAATATVLLDTAWFGEEDVRRSPGRDVTPPKNPAPLRQPPSTPKKEQPSPPKDLSTPSFPAQVFTASHLPSHLFLFSSAQHSPYLPPLSTHNPPPTPHIQNQVVRLATVIVSYVDPTSGSENTKELPITISRGYSSNSKNNNSNNSHMVLLSLSMRASGAVIAASAAAANSAALLQSSAPWLLAANESKSDSLWVDPRASPLVVTTAARFQAAEVCARAVAHTCLPTHLLTRPSAPCPLFTLSQALSVAPS
jgi:hypothetical protein